MSRHDRRIAAFAIIIPIAAVFGSICGPARAVGADQDLTSEQVKGALSSGMGYLASQQISNGSFLSGGLGRGAYPVGPTALATLSLLNSGMDTNDPVIRRALHYLRDYHDPGGTYETSLMIMALVAAKEWDRDKLRIASLAAKLETMQTPRGMNAGMWNYGLGQLGGGSEDNSNSQFAILGLR